MNYFKIIISLIVSSIILGACQNDLLDKYPLDQVTSAAFFKKSNDLKLYTNQFYDRGNFPERKLTSQCDLGYDTNIDEKSVNTVLQGTRTVLSGSAFNYTSIRNVNYFFDNYKKCEDDFDDYKQYVGEAHFFRAFFYFELLKKYGGVPWITSSLDLDSPELYASQDPRNVIADNIIADLDSATMYLTDDKTNGCSRINKWIALLLQSRVALYEGTWEKYHANDPFGVSSPQPEKYLTKVIEAATAIMKSGLYDIYSTGNPTSDYVDLFGLRDYSSNSEVMFWTKMDLDLGIYSHRKLSYLETPMGFGLTKSMADSYLCTDGKPITISPLFKGYSSIMTEMKNRDPRFYQTIFTPDAAWLIDDGITTTWDELYTNKLFSNSTYACPTGYVRRKDYNPYTKYHDLNFESTPSLQYRYAEVLLNFAEAKAELGEINQSDIDISIKKLRDRVGMPNLILNNIVPDPNWNFPDLSPTLNEIRRERKIELVIEDLRWDDIARWAAADELIVGKRPKGEMASQFAITPEYPVDSEGFMDPFKKVLPNGYGFKINRDYLSPISKQELKINENLVQNPGWED